LSMKLRDFVAIVALGPDKRSIKAVTGNVKYWEPSYR
jgi:hypothetical protein